MTTVSAENLARITANVMKFVNPKSIYLPGEMRFYLTNDELSCYACDDYIALTDKCPVLGGTSGRDFVLSLANVKDLEKFAREAKKFDITIRHEGSIVTFGSDENNLKFETLEYREENWEIVDFILFEDLEPTELGKLYFRPERFTKFSQLKHDKDAPMVWDFVEGNGHPLVRLKIGETLRGVIRPVTPEKVAEQYL
jgi:hypothetical protein